MLYKPWLTWCPYVVILYIVCSCYVAVLLLFCCCYVPFYAPLRRREGILLCTCRTVCLLVCPSVTFSFPINNSRTPWPTLLKLCPHIRLEQQRNPIDFGQRSRSSGSNVSKLQQFPKINFFLHLCNLFWTDLSSFTKYLWQKNSLGGIIFYKHLLFVAVM